MPSNPSEKKRYSSDKSHTYKEAGAATRIVIREWVLIFEFVLLQKLGIKDKVNNALSGMNKIWMERNKVGK